MRDVTRIREAGHQSASASAAPDFTRLELGQQWRHECFGALRHISDVRAVASVRASVSCAGAVAKHRQPSCPPAQARGWQLPSAE